MNVVLGSPAAPGIGIGNAFILPEEQERIIPKRRISQEEVEPEWKRFTDACRNVQNELNSHIQDEKISKDQHDVLETYLLMIQDPVFITELKAYMDKELFNIEFSINLKVADYADMLRNSGNEYLAERAQDIEDVFNRVIDVLLDYHSFDIEQIPDDSVIIGRTMKTSDTIILSKRKIAGLALTEGSSACHVAILAKSYGIPVVVAIDNAAHIASQGDTVIVDGNIGEVIVQPDIATITSTNTKIIAEPWDCAGLYQLGGFPAGENSRWSEWNGRFRDDIRRFNRGDENVATAAATRIAGSSDCYNHSGKKPMASINFITAHDGFTLNDLVSYNYKHNDENGEQNRDGSDDNISYNHGFEGECTNPKIENIRKKTIKNFFVHLMTAQGVPMMLGGDEMRRTQNGNNNAYCQDNEISWFNWDLAVKNQGLVRFSSKLIELRKNHPVFRRTSFFTETSNEQNVPEISWYDPFGKVPDWSKTGRFLAYKLDGQNQDNDFYVATNLDLYDMTITLPALAGEKKWYRVADTSFDSPEDILEIGQEELLPAQRRYVLVSGSSVVLMSK